MSNIFFNLPKHCSILKCYQIFSVKLYNTRHFYGILRNSGKHLKSKVVLSSYMHKIHTNVENKQLGEDQDLNKFNEAYENIQKSLLYSDDKAIIDALSWNLKVLDYNVQGGKKNRGVTVLKSYKAISQKTLSSDGIAQACILGWCVEMLQGFFLVLDDIMDNSLTRRGKPSWYRKADVGLVAINDGLLLEHSIYKILEMHFEKSKAYNNILQEFLKVTRKTVYGQTLDMLNVPPNKKPNYENFSLEKYCAIVEYKTAYYTFCLPVHLAMHLDGNFSKNDFEITRNICLKLGLLFQIQDDYLDIYGDSSVTGKIGTDITDGKCSWFAAYVFQHASPDIKQIMMDNYGVNEPNSISRVMKVFEDMDLKRKFHELEQTLEKEIKFLIQDTVSNGSLRGLFFTLLQTLYKRQK